MQNHCSLMTPFKIPDLQNRKQLCSPGIVGNYLVWEWAQTKTLNKKQTTTQQQQQQH
jgi:hypothetical protein